VDSYIREYNANVPGQYVDILYGNLIGAEFDGLYPYPSINSTAVMNGWSGIGFAALDSGYNHLGTWTSAGAYRIQLGTELPHMMMADNNHFVIRRGTTAITLLPPGFLPFTDVAIVSSGLFSGTMGKRPGISDDGTIVVWYGTLTQAGATSFQTYTGPGIFAAMVDCTQSPPAIRARMRVAGLTMYESGGGGDGDGICDPGEYCATAAELGYGDAGAITFADFDDNKRVGVTNAVDGSFVVSFFATPSSASMTNPRTGQPYSFSAQPGLWTVRVDGLRPLSIESPGGTGPLTYHPTSPTPVAQIGDVIGGRKITAINSYDPIASVPVDDSGVTRVQRRGDHRLAFWATDSLDVQMVLRATRLDSDQDGLADHWETDGLDADRDGSVDLDLAAMGASPTHRDIFLELDWLKPTSDGREFSPNIEALRSVVQMFAAAPPDPVVGGGITLHIDAGEELSRGHGLNMDSGPWQGGDEVVNPAGGGHIGLLQFGLPGVGDAAMTDVKEAYFGLADKRAREFAFHLQRAMSSPSDIKL
jgi:hypothetical protein